jgi:hypothetical protein
MSRDLFDPSSEEQVVVLVDTATIRKAESFIERCEHCDAAAPFPLKAILDWITSSSPSVTDYVLEVPAHCPNCGAELLEDALVVPAASA